MDGSQGQTAPLPASSPDPALIAFAGIWERWRDAKGEATDTVAILTCPSNATIMRLHDRMPVVLAREAFEAWLDVKGTAPEPASKLLSPAPDDLFESIELDPKINDSKREEPDILEPLQSELLL
jgi:putative SOS response-associated peptidase YedK